MRSSSGSSPSSLDTRRVVRQLEPGRGESLGDEADRQLYYAILGAMEAGLVRMSEDLLTVFRQACSGRWG